jgi:CubicO group peptidase (beta-lactamase class C family)
VRRLVTLALFLSACSDPDAELDRFITARMAASESPGLSALVIKNHRIVWSRAYGLADIEANIAAGEGTLYICASVSKLMTGTLALQLRDEGKLSLDDDVSQHVGFVVRNPAFPSTAITVRQLLTHTSSIRDSVALLANHVSVGDSPITLARLTEGYLVPGGEFYDPVSYSAFAPGVHFDYSNIGTALLGYLVERVEGQPFSEVAKRKLFVPLAMPRTSFRLSDVDTAQLAVAYDYNPSDGQLRKPHQGFSYFPASSLHTSTHELARFFLAMLGGGTLDGMSVLRASTIAEAQQVVVPPDQGLQWQFGSYGGERVVGHSGSAQGVSTEAYTRVSDGVTMLILSNSNAHFRAELGASDAGDAFNEIGTRLFAEAARF